MPHDPHKRKLDDERLDAAFAAYLRCCDDGEVDHREAFLEQFPELESELRKLIDAAEMIQRITGAGNTSTRRIGTKEDSQPPRFAADAETVAVTPTPIGNREPSPAASSADASGASSEGRSVVTRGRGRAADADAGEDGATALGDSRGHEVHATLPVENRAQGDPGPRLPYDLGDYRLLRIIGRGGMGIVYLAKQKNLDREVAVKMIRSGMLAGEAEVRRFHSEARAAARLQHPNIVTVHHFGYLDGHHYFSMDYVPGTDLAHILAKGPLSFEDASRYVRDCARAIHYAHRRGILHRDLKPANVLIDEANQVQITDFGLAKHTDADSSLTVSGTAVGTPNFMAPEQASGHGDRADRTADVYALGAILFALLTGRPPFSGETVMQTLMQVVHREAPSPRELRPDIPPDLETIVCKCLEKETKKRYHTAEALADELNRFLEGRPIHARRRGRLMRLWHWLCEVPIVAALTGRRFLETSQSHRRFQAGLIGLLVLLPVLLAGVLAADRWYQERMPGEIRVGGGLEGGVYDDLSAELARRIGAKYGVESSMVSTEGSLDNRQRVLSGELDLAPMQSSAIHGGQLCVVAPLFYEAVHVLARRDTGIASFADLRGKTVAVGPEGSGSRLAAELLFDSSDFGEGALQRVIMPWSRLSSDPTIDAAVLCIGRGSTLVTELLRDEQFILVPIPEAIRVALDHPTLLPLSILPEDYPHADIPSAGLQTVGTTAFLAARIDTPDVLVTAALEAIYQDPPLIRGMIPRRYAAEFRGMQLHPAARAFFDQ